MNLLPGVQPATTFPISPHQRAMKWKTIDCPVDHKMESTCLCQLPWASIRSHYLTYKTLAFLFQKSRLCQPPILISRIVKNCDRSEILAYSQVNKLAWYSFLDAKGPFITALEVALVSAFFHRFPDPQFLQGDTKRSR